jgi:hypothetical protein
MSNRLTAVFDERASAEAAIDELRRAGVLESELTIIARQVDFTPSPITEESAGEELAAGTVTGAGVGALFGLAAALIPGIGPFVTAGTLLSAALGLVVGSTAAGAIIGGTAGLVGSALARAGFDAVEAHYYGHAVEQGAILVTVDTTRVDLATVRNVFQRHGGRSPAVTA